MRNDEIEDLYGLSPLQEGMLFHSLYAPEGGVYVVQVVCTVRGKLDKAAFEQSWQKVVDRHPILRTAFFWEVIDKPVQIVFKNAKVVLKHEDWRALAGSQQQQLDDYLKADRRLGFDLHVAPLMRLALVQLADEEYQFIWTHHHLLMDGWCMSVLMDELFTFYNTLSRGEDVTLEPAGSYGSYIEWLQRQDLPSAEAFWRKGLAGFASPTPLPGERSVACLAEAEPSRAELEFKIPGSLVNRLQYLARDRQLTINTIFQGAWSLLLSRYSGRDDVIFGATVSGRPPEVGFERIMGLFINTLPVRVRVNPAEPLLPWLRQLQEQQAEARGYEYSPLVEVQGWSEVPGQVRLFDCVYCFENYPVKSVRPGPAGGSSAAVEIGEIHSLEQNSFPLTISISPPRDENADDLVIRIMYDASRFDKTAIGQLAEHFQNLLRGFVETPELPLARISMLSAAEREQLLHEWNQTFSDVPTALVHELFAERARQHPEVMALRYGDERLSYSELERRTNQLAHHLQRLGVGPEVVVGICLERTPQMVVALLAVLKAGGAYLPLDPEYPLERLSFMLKDAAAKVLLSERELLTHLAPLVEHGLCLDEWIANESETAPECAAVPENLAYVMYTSGSTGQPKGVMITHHGLRNYLCWARETYQLSEGNGVPLHSSICFDLSVTSLYGPLLSGQCLELRELPQALEQQGDYSLVKLTPAHMTLLREQLAEVSIDRSARRYIIGGENLLWSELQWWSDAAGGSRFYNEYGPTETVVGCCVYEFTKIEAESGSVPIGRAIANTEMYVLDEELEPVPVGVSGEIYIGGAGVARGYLQRAGLTAEKFIPDAFSGRVGARLYRSGDVGRYRGDGNIEYRGRLDQQVKVRGYRIELGEIEAVLGQHAAVAQCVVNLRETESGDKRLVAYMVWERGLESTVEELRNYVTEQLPEYMVPGQWVVLDELPLAASGKVDRAALPAPEQSELKYVAPRTATEEIVAGIWAEVLEVEQVGVHDNFFALGGHSLLATQVILRARSAFAVQLPLRSLFEHMTLSSLSSRIEQLRLSGMRSVAPPLLPRVATIDGGVPPSFAQQRLWFLDQLEPNNPFYNIPTGVRLSGELNIEALERALSEIVRRHEVLRTSFTTVAGEPLQVISAATEIKLPVEDLSFLPVKEREQEAQRLAAEEAREPFDLSRGPLLRVRLIRLAVDDHVLLVTMHHIVSDGWSMGVLVREVSALYEAYCVGSESPLPELPIQYADFAVWQRQWLSGAVLEEQLSYWREQLRDLSTLELPVDRVRPAMQSYRGATVRVAFGREETAALKELSRREGATLFMVLLAAFQVLLSRYSGQSDVVVGTDVANRQTETEGLIGFFVNQLVLRTDLNRATNFVEVVQQVREICLAAYEHQDVPFEKLVEELQPERDLSRAPLFQVKFIFQNVPGGTLHLGNLSLSSAGGEGRTAKYDLLLALSESNDGISGVFEYSTDLFEARTIERMQEHFQQLLRSIAAAPELPLTQVSILTPAEREQLREWNQTSTDFPPLLLHELFEAQARQQPAAIALHYKDERMSYGELERRANQLAHHLQRLGVGPEVLVGICLERSPQLVVALLAVLKAGGAYLPLDPAHPAERLSFMLEDAAVRVVLSESAVLERLPAHWGYILCLDEEWEQIAKESEAAPESGTVPENLAYVLYTSGSTGQPKGVQITHQGISNHMQWMQRDLPLEAGDRVLQKTAFSFDASVWEFYAPLQAGAQLVLLPAEQQQDVGALLETVVSEEITILQMVPTQLRLLAQAEKFAECGSLRRIFSGGEELLTALAAEVAGSTGAELYNLYGPTEASIEVSYHRYESSVDEARRSVPIGRAIANAELYLLDEELEAVPVGVVGEIYIGGPGLARGYLQRAGLTAERFIPDGKSGRSGARLYRTGDQGRHLGDGSIEYLGRLDQQVKLRGYRIELGEIESVLGGHEGVAQCVVSVQQRESGDQRLVGYVVREPGQEVGVSELRRYLSERLPEYMVPSQWVWLEELPLTASGKVDRRALPEAGENELAGKQYVAPRTATEETLAKIWAEVLEIEQVGIHDHFFQLGGHSLLATQTVLQVRNVFDIHLPLRSLFEAPTIAKWASVIDQKVSEKTSSDISRIGITSQGYKTLEQLMLDEMDQPRKSESISSDLI